VVQRYSWRPPYLRFVLAGGLLRGRVSATMSIGQWDTFLQTVYDQGGVLIELDDRERVVATYRQCDWAG
jgi:hypothetical protein